MKGIIRTGDTHTGGGKVLRGSSNMKFGGIGAAGRSRQLSDQRPWSDGDCRRAPHF